MSETTHLHAKLPNDLIDDIDRRVDGRVVRTRTAALILIIEAGLKALGAPVKAPAR